MGWLLACTAEVSVAPDLCSRLTVLMAFANTGFLGVAAVRTGAQHLHEVCTG